MLEPGRKHFRFDEIACHWSREPEQRYSKDEFLGLLVVAFWRGEFNADECGWDMDNWMRKFSDNYPLEPLPDFIFQKHTNSAPETVWENEGGALFSSVHGDRYRIDLRPFQSTKYSDFEAIDQPTAFEVLLYAQGDPVAQQLLSLAEGDRYEELAKTPLKDYSEYGRLSLGTLSLTKKALASWCESRKIIPPRFAQADGDDMASERPQKERIIQRKQRDDAIQTAGNALWNTNPELTKYDVAFRLAEKKEFKNLRSRDGGYLEADSIERILHKPKNLRKRRKAI